MIPLSLARIAQVTGGTVGAAGRSDTGDAGSVGGTADPGEIVVDGPVVTDSREAGPGGLYVARIGEHADGHIYTPQAVAAGATNADELVPLSDVARGDAPVSTGRVLFKGSGMAWQDLVVAEAVLDHHA